MSDNAPSYAVVCVEAHPPATIRIIEIATCATEEHARTSIRALYPRSDLHFYVLPLDPADPGGDRAAFTDHIRQILAAYGITIEAPDGP